MIDKMNDLQPITDEMYRKILNGNRKYFLDLSIIPYGKAMKVSHETIPLNYLRMICKKESKRQNKTFLVLNNGKGNDYTVCYMPDK
jgi:neutral trehalase